ncbi:MAG: SCP2 sterol-binding domain-containing protein [Gammaproteobacteria bacterium]|nr:SCP2 sterol-binding domain-containing protein [Gammaproteobacteria bacterium]
MLPLFAAAVLEKALDQCLRLDAESLRKVTMLEGKVIAVVISGLEIQFYLVPTANGLRVQSVFEGVPDVTLRGGPVSLLRLSTSKHPSSLFGDGVSIEGDVDLGRRVQSILDGLDLDWEEQLSKLTGDVIAHQVGNLFRGAQRWHKQAVDTVERDVAEYFQHESRDLVAPLEMKEFLEQVDALRLDSDRLEQRVKRLREFVAQHSGKMGV